MQFCLQLLGLCLIALHGLGQSAAKDSTFNRAARYAITQHEQVSNTLERLYNGPEYISYDRRLTGHAFFPTDTMHEGQVAYEGGLYTVPLLYDIVKDLVVVVHTSGYRMSLHSDRVQRFSVDNHTFIRLDSSQAMPKGFYDLLYNGPTRLLARRTKDILVNPTSFGYGLYNPKTTYYIRKNGRYFPVKNKRAFLALMGDRRKQLMSYARQQKLSFRPSPERAFLQLTQQYDQLNSSL
jgi:hypothetical protein